MITSLGRGAVPNERCRLIGRVKMCELLRDNGFVTIQKGFLTIPPGGKFSTTASLSRKDAKL